MRLVRNSFAGTVGRVSVSAHQAPKDEAPIPRVAPIEAENEFVDIGVEVVIRDRSVVGAEEPSLQERGYAMDGGMDLVSPDGRL